MRLVSWLRCLFGIQPPESNSPHAEPGNPLRVAKDMARHYIAYHNTERMGPLPDADALCVWTNKSVTKLPGSVVWLVVGEGGHPRRYTLASVFRVSKVGPADHPGFKNCVRGEGHVFQPRPNLRGKAHTIYRQRFDEPLEAAKEEKEQERERGGPHPNHRRL